MDNLASDPLFYVVAGAMILVLFVLLMGLASFTKGGAFNAKYGNKLMQARLLAQAVAIALLLGFVYLRSHFGG